MNELFHMTKRFLDILFSSLFLVLLSPLIIVLALMVFFCDLGPIFFFQRRVGQYSQPFTIFKFRTMHVGSKNINSADGSFVVQPDDSRITRVGHFMRLGFDELPQLFNILIGDMSFVGPRPDHISALDLLHKDHTQKLSVRPGITGLSQVTGRTDLSWNTRNFIDCYYANNLSFGLDLLIVILTPLTILLPQRSYPLSRSLMVKYLRLPRDMWQVSNENKI